MCTKQVVVFTRLIPLFETWMNPHTVIIYKVMSFKITIFYWQQTVSYFRKRHDGNWFCVFETILCSARNAVCTCVYHLLVAAVRRSVNPLNPELIPISYLLALLEAHHFLHVSRIRVKLLTFRRLMSYIYGAPILDVSRSHTTTQHSR